MLLVCVSVDVPRGQQTAVNGSRGGGHVNTGDSSVQSRGVSRGVVDSTHVRPSTESRSADGRAGVGVVFLGATLGVASVLAALMVALVLCLVAAGRRRRRQRLNKHQRPTSADHHDDMATTQLALRATNNHYVSSSSLQTRAATSPLPPVPLPPTRKDSRTSSTSSPQPYRGPGTSSLPAGARSCGYVPPPATLMSAAAAGDVDPYIAAAMLRHHHQQQQQQQQPHAVCMPQHHHQQLGGSTGHSDPGSDRPLSMSELPPPPDFLLENAGGGPEVHLSSATELQLQAQPGRCAPAHLATSRPQPRQHDVALMLDDQLLPGDGYRSADSVDDDIDDVIDFRQPATHLLRYPL